MDEDLLTGYGVSRWQETCAEEWLRMREQVAEGDLYSAAQTQRLLALMYLLGRDVYSAAKEMGRLD